MTRAGKWEFPGGKLHAGETPEDCIVREIREELALAVEPVAVLAPVRHRYPDITIELIPVVCRRIRGRPSLTEHAEAAWLSAAELEVRDWAPADIEVIRRHREILFPARSVPARS